MHALATRFFARYPALSLAALGAAENVRALDLRPAGIPVEFLPAEQHGALARQYLELNQLAFGKLGLPNWVLSDLYLQPGAIGLLRCPARMLKEESRQLLRLPDEEQVIAAAYYAAPTLVRGQFIGVSLLSFLPGVHAGAWVKALTLKMLGARRMRGIAQWNNLSLRVHTRLGPLRLVGHVPGVHDYVERSFLYEMDLVDEARQVAAMERRFMLEPTLRLSASDSPALGALLRRAEAGEVLYLVPPGLEGGDVLVREGPLPPSTGGP
ncbi:hypothetical protein POL68_30210 [Stigmatella sp. ncwal1]|uniref:N-acetyltransferase domain-containing protein n=1 Tax=Stigmatella ashevillensis TaxID=2995309 RepID=A0ABT5DJ00_9BACT|nr:hypothetical protein [Stigmatella ashevillena]MDC0712773.1 hypothetical protein [Stigmatella ashevillena]